MRCSWVSHPGNISIRRMNVRWRCVFKLWDLETKQLSWHLLCMAASQHGIYAPSCTIWTISWGLRELMKSGSMYTLSSLLVENLGKWIVKCGKFVVEWITECYFSARNVVFIAGEFLSRGLVIHLKVGLKGFAFQKTILIFDRDNAIFTQPVKQ